MRSLSLSSGGLPGGASKAETSGTCVPRRPCGVCAGHSAWEREQVAVSMALAGPTPTSCCCGPSNVQARGYSQLAVCMVLKAVKTNCVC